MEFDYDAGVVYGAGDGAAGDPRLREENEDLRKELRRLREECKRLKENNRRQEQHISILTATCQQFVEELESSGEAPTRRESRVAVLTPPSSGRSSYSSLPDSDDDHCSSTTSTLCVDAETHTHMELESSLHCSRCQQLSEELAETRQELQTVDRLLQCAVKQKFYLQEQLCHFEDDIGRLVEKDIAHRLT